MPRIVRWSDDPGGLPVEDCARRGIEAVAGLVISRDIFGTNRYPDAHFCTCAEISHSVTGTSGNFDDHIGVSFRVVEIKDGTYPLVGHESVRMAMQPMSDGNVSARWNAVGRQPPGQRQGDAGLLAGELDALSCVCRPLALGTIPEQDDGRADSPSFLILKDPGAGWQIWRRFVYPAGDAGSGDSNGTFEESYIMVYPMFSPDMNWRFRIHDVPGGGLRWEVVSRNQR